MRQSFSALYSGTLTAFLAIPEYERPIDSLSDVLEATKQGLIPVVIRESSVHYMFKVGYPQVKVSGQGLPYTVPIPDSNDRVGVYLVISPSYTSQGKD